MAPVGELQNISFLVLGKTERQRQTGDFFPTQGNEGDTEDNASEGEQLPEQLPELRSPPRPHRLVNYDEVCLASEELLQTQTRQVVPNWIDRR